MKRVWGSLTLVGIANPEVWGLAGFSRAETSTTGGCHSIACSRARRQTIFHTGGEW